MEKIFKQFSDIRIKKLIKKHGYIGFGVYNAILQDMYSNDNCMTVDSEFLASEYEVSEQVINSILNDFSLFENTDGMYASCLIAEIFEKKKVKSDKTRESIRVRWNKEREKLYERNTNVYERNTNVYERNTNVYERNTNVSENLENEAKNVKSIKMCENTIVDEPNEINTEYGLIQENCTEKKVKKQKEELLSMYEPQNHDDSAYKITMAFWKLFRDYRTNKGISCSKINTATASWIKDTQKLLKISSIEDISEIYKYLFNEQDSEDKFKWIEVVSSISGIIKHYDKLIIKAKNYNNGSNKSSNQKGGATWQQLEQLLKSKLGSGNQ